MSASGHLRPTWIAGISTGVRGPPAATASSIPATRTITAPLARPPVALAIEAMRITRLTPIEESLGRSLAPDDAAAQTVDTR